MTAISLGHPDNIIHTTTELAPLSDGYTIVSHGGIGDEHREYGDEERSRYNLSGSCHELRIFFGKSVYRILIDVGAYQGRGKLERDMAEIFKGVDAILLTHPHMDHIGDYPRAFIDDVGFTGKVYATPATRDAAEIALTDAANILARDAANKQYGYIKMLQDIAGALVTVNTKSKIPRTANGNNMRRTGDIPNRKQDMIDAQMILAKFRVDTSKGADNYKKQMAEFEPEKPAYTPEDVEGALNQIETHTIEDGWKDLIPGKLAFRFYNAGHIIGSVSVLFRITENGKNRNVLFSGDLGSYKWDFHPTGLPVPPHNLPIDTVLIESTYGGKVRPDFAIGLRDFQENLKHDLDKYKHIILSTFAMDRTQIMLDILIQMQKRGEINADIILDSPAGTKHTMNYLKHSKQLDPTISKHVPSIHKALHNNFVIEEQKRLTEFIENIDPANSYYTIANSKNKGSVFADNGKSKIIITSSGMAEGGMVISHLEKNLGNPEVAFYFPGYLVPGTLGYALASDSQPGGQQKNVKISGKTYEVQARIKQFNFLSGHGDEEDLQTWLGALKLRQDATIRIVHGDVSGSSLAFKHTLERKGYQGKNVIVPNIGEVNYFPIEKKSEKGTPKKPAAKLKK